MPQTTLAEYGDCILHQCTIGSVPSDRNTYALRSIKIFEDHCKPYFTAQMVIDSYQNSTDTYLYPTSEVIVSFLSPSSDPSFPTSPYTQRFRVFSHESREVPGGQAVAHKIHTISLIGQEYYNDKHNNVISLDANVPATVAAQRIHGTYITGNIKTTHSSGPIGTTRQPHQSSNLKPFKAINDLLDRAVWTRWQTCCPVYFKTARGHVMAPLQSLLEARPLGDVALVEHQAQGTHDLSFIGNRNGYQSILAIKPLSPSGEASSGVKASDVSGMLKAASFFDTNQGKFKNMPSILGKVMGMFSGGAPGVRDKIRPMLAEAYKGNRGGGHLLNVLSTVMQPQAIQKAGQAGYNVSQEALVTALTYSDKYWVQIPGQSGHKITCGDKVAIRYYVIRDGRPVPRDKALYVARLVHNITFLENDPKTGKRKRASYKAKTELYGVDWS
jgi:hypothetical protein